MINPCSFCRYVFILIANLIDYPISVLVMCCYFPQKWFIDNLDNVHRQICCRAFSKKINIISICNFYFKEKGNITLSLLAFTLSKTNENHWCHNNMNRNFCLRQQCTQCQIINLSTEWEDIYMKKYVMGKY